MYGNRDAELGGKELRKRLVGCGQAPWIENTSAPRKRPTKTPEVTSWTNLSHREDLKAESSPGLLVGLCLAK
jgi:hypothetical protein